MKLGDVKQRYDCLLCDGYIQAGEDKAHWGFEWDRGWVHLKCVKAIGDAAQRMEVDEEYRHRLVRRVGIWKREDIELLLSQSWADQHRFLFKFVRLPVFDWLRVGILDTRFKTLKERRGGPG